MNVIKMEPEVDPLAVQTTDNTDIELKQHLSENKVLRKIFGAKRDEVTGEWRKLHNTELQAFYSSPDIIRNLKSRRLRWAGHVARMGESRNAYRVLVGRPEGKRPLGRPRRRWEDNIKMDLREEGNLLDANVTGIKMECMDHSDDLKLEIAFEQTAVSIGSPIVKTEAEERNISNMGGLKTECVDPSCDLTSDVNAEDTQVPFCFAVVKCEVEDTPNSVNSPVLKSEVDGDLLGVDRVHQEQNVEVSSEEDEVLTESIKENVEEERNWPPYPIISWLSSLISDALLMSLVRFKPVFGQLTKQQKKISRINLLAGSHVPSIIRYDLMYWGNGTKIGSVLILQKKAIINLCYNLSYITDEDMSNKTSKFIKITGVINSVFKSSHVQKHTRLKVYKTLARPVLTYGSEAWTIRKANDQRLTTAEMRFMRRTAGCSLLEHRKNVDILQELKMDPVVNFVQQYRHQWKKHAERMDRTRWPKQILTYVPRGKRKLGRPRKRWHETVTDPAGSNTIVDNLQKSVSEEHTSNEEDKLIQCGSQRLDGSNITDISDNSIKCNICNEVFVTPKCLKLHSFIHATKKSFKCDVCGKCFSESSILNRHTRIHTGERPFRCEFCGKGFSDSGHLKIHFRLHTGERPFKCDECGKCFSAKALLKRHARIHTGERPFKCEICGKCFSESGNLKIHSRLHTGERPFKCDACGKCFSMNTVLKRHARIHTGERPFKCNVCGKCFSESCNLKIHSRLHTGETPFKCDECGMCFSMKPVLKRHALKHVGESPFKCDVCGKCFSESCHLKNHFRIHTGEKPFKCDICGWCFSMKAVLKRHARIHTGEKPFKCDICGKCFSESGNLKIHFRLHTGKRPFK
ncbi:hypothetical protein ANN_27876 [Periplaneta americana]|uniref:C2H2-type domain-containing protein n=1 Tax=Periplaneta americana TaxID=6978 RepID=A0ABQ8RVH2_PERAM|nr:hypothetical protein ANN_27876 [Periplaneta americana]